MRTTYKIEYTKTLEPMKNSKWFYLFGFLVILLSFIMAKEIGLWIIGFMVGIPILFQLILPLNYYFHDKNMNLTVDYAQNQLEFRKGSKEMIIPFNQIAKIERKNGSKYPRPFDVYVIPSNFYHYTTIHTKNKEIISFTHFLKEGIDIWGVPQEKKVIPFLNIIKNSVL
jgi:hypothetical protein